MKKYRVDWYKNINSKRYYFYTDSLKSALEKIGQKKREKMDFIRLCFCYGSSYAPGGGMDTLYGLTYGVHSYLLKREGLTREDALKLVYGKTSPISPTDKSLGILGGEL